MKKQQDQGFTLIELLIVIVILGILAAVTVFAVGRVTDSAQDTSCEIEERTIRTAIEAVAIDNGGTYPTNFEDPGFGNYFDPADLPAVDADDPAGNLSERWQIGPPDTGNPNYTLTGLDNCAP